MMRNFPFIFICAYLCAFVLLAFVDREKELAEREPAIHFYTAEAYDNCISMGAQAKAKGFRHWICERPADFDKYCRPGDQCR